MLLCVFSAIRFAILFPSTVVRIVPVARHEEIERKQPHLKWSAALEHDLEPPIRNDLGLRTLSCDPVSSHSV